MSTEVQNCSQNVVHRRASRCTEKESGGMVQPVWTVCLYEIIGCVTDARKKELTRP